MSTILIVDDDDRFRQTLRATLENADYYVLDAENLAQAAEAIAGKEIDAVLLDIKLGDENGAAFLAAHKHLLNELPVIVLTGQGGTQTAIDLMKQGAYDFVTKAGMDVLLLRLGRAIEKRLLCLTAKSRSSTSSDGQSMSDGLIVGSSQAIIDVATKIARLNESHDRVLIRGEQGTGKELVARSLVQNSPRSQKPFITFSAANIVDTLAESELFGHVKGAFAGAHQDNVGLIKAADTGTLFIDELGEMSLHVQACLLRWLQEGEYRQVGGTQTRRVDVRVIAATNRDLESAIRDGTFRRELFDRLNVNLIKLPPLRERAEDVSLLARNFLRGARILYGKADLAFTKDALALLNRHTWPGNVRELQNVVQRAVVNAWGKWIDLKDIQATLDEETKEPKRQLAPSPADHLLMPAPAALVVRSLEEVEKEHIARVLSYTKWNQTKAAEILEIDRKTLGTKMIRYELQQ